MQQNLYPAIVIVCSDLNKIPTNESDTVLKLSNNYFSGIVIQSVPVMQLPNTKLVIVWYGVTGITIISG